MATNEHDFDPSEEPDPSVADTILGPFLTNWTASIEAQGVAAGGRILRRDDLAAVDLGRPSFGVNVATLLAPIPPTAVTGALDDFYGFTSGTGTGTVFLFSPWPLPDFQSHGWTLLGTEPLMRRPPGGAPPSPPPGLRIEEVRDEAGVRAFERTVVRAFAAPELEAYGPGAVFAPAILADNRSRLWIGWEGAEPVSAASAFIAAGINGVTIVGTVPEKRGHGYGAALTWRATLAAPALPALLLATDEGRRVYERLGYRILRRFTLWSRERPDSARRDFPSLPRHT